MNMSRCTALGSEHVKRHPELTPEVWVSILRWTNANPAEVFKMQTFGGELGDFREVSGYRRAFRVDGGSFFGTPDYLPFYRARVKSIRVQ